MDYNKLYYFYVVAGQEHVTKAAEQLHIAQPSVTKSIKQLEDELGVKLFERTGRNIRLTFYGRYLKNKLDGLFMPLDAVAKELEVIKKEKSQIIRLNVLSASSVVTDAVIEYKKKNSTAIFQFMQQETKEECDISISTNDPAGAAASKLHDRCIIEERIYLAVPQRSRYAESESIDLSEVRDEGFITLASSRSFRAVCDAFCLRAGFQPKITFESDSPETVKNIIRSNAGVAFWPEFSWGAVADSTGMKLLPIRSPVCSRELIAELHQNEFMSEAAGGFFSFLVDYLRERQQTQGVKLS